MLKIGTRKNSIYPFMSMIFNFGCQVIIFLLNSDFFLFGHSKDSTLFLMLMFFAEFLSGLLLTLYEIAVFRENTENENKKIMGIKLIYNPIVTPLNYNCYEIYFLIFVVAFFDFNQFLISTYYVKKLQTFSSIYLDARLRSVLTFFCAIGCWLLLNMKMYTHQIYSLLVIIICIIIVIITELLFHISIGNKDEVEITPIVIIAIISGYFFNANYEVIEKSLMEYNYINPFKLLFTEGVFGLMLTSSMLIITNPFKPLKVYFENVRYTQIQKYSLIICLMLFFLFSCGRNIYRISSNKIFSPTTRAFTDCIPDPLLIIFYYFYNKDHILHFILSLIVTIIMLFCSCIYNELFVLYCCGLEYNTHHEISLRATTANNMSEITESESDE